MIVYNKDEVIEIEINCDEHGHLRIISDPLKKMVTVEGVMCPFCLFLYPVELDFKSKK